MPYSKDTVSARPESVESFQVDAGSVWLNYGEAEERKLGATRGGATLTVEQELRQMEIDGVRFAAMGTERLSTGNATLAINLLEMSMENLLIMFPGATFETVDLGATGGTTHNRIFRDRNITLGDYIPNITVIGEVLGKTQRQVLMVRNVIQVENFEAATAQDDEVVAAGTFRGHIDLADLDATGQTEEPWSVYTPVA